MIRRRNGLVDEREASRRSAEEAKARALDGTATYSLVRDSNGVDNLKLEGYGYVAALHGDTMLYPRNLGVEIPREILRAGVEQAKRRVKVPMKRRNPALVDQVRALSATQKSIYQNARHLGVGPREALALAISGRYLRTAKPVRPTPKLHDALARSRYVQQDAREALDAALSLGNMAGVRKYAAQIKAARQAEHDVATALGEVGQRAGGHWTAKRDAKAKAWFKDDFEASKVAGWRAGKAVGRRNPAGGRLTWSAPRPWGVVYLEGDGDGLHYEIEKDDSGDAFLVYLERVPRRTAGETSLYLGQATSAAEAKAIAERDATKRKANPAKRRKRAAFVSARRRNPAASAGKLAYDAILRAALAAADAAPRERPTGIGRVYVVIDKVHRRGVAAAAKKVGLRYLQKAYGTSDGVLYIGYDNASGRELARGAAIARVLKAAGIGAYRDEVAD